MNATYRIYIRLMIKWSKTDLSCRELCYASILLNLFDLHLMVHEICSFFFFYEEQMRNKLKEDERKEKKQI